MSERLHSRHYPAPCLDRHVTQLYRAHIGECGTRAEPRGPADLRVGRKASCFVYLHASTQAPRWPANGTTGRISRLIPLAIALQPSEGKESHLLSFGRE